MGNTRLADIAIPSGLQTGPFGSQLKASEYVPVGVPVVMPQDIRGGRISLDKVARVSEAKAASLHRHRLHGGDILFARRGDLAKIALIGPGQDGWLCGTGCLRVRVDTARVEPRFVLQYLALPKTAHWLQSNALGQTMLNLNTEIVGQLPIPLPSLDEQRRIADILATWDAAIDKIERLIGVLRRRNTLLAQQLLASIAQGKRSVLLGDIAAFHVGRTPSRSVAKYWCSNHASADSHVWLSIADLAAGGVITESKERISDFAVRECGMRPVEKGTLLLSFKLTLGRTAIAGRLLFTNEAIVALTPRGEGFEPSFLCHVLPLLHWETAGNRAAKGRTLNREALQALRLPNVPLPEQRRIAAILNRAGREVDLLELLTLAYRRQKRGLMAGCLSTGGSRS